MIPQEADQTHIEYGFPVLHRSKPGLKMLQQDLAQGFYYYLTER